MTQHCAAKKLDLAQLFMKHSWRMKGHAQIMLLSRGTCRLDSPFVHCMCCYILDSDLIKV